MGEVGAGNGGHSCEVQGLMIKTSHPFNALEKGHWKLGRIFNKQLSNIEHEGLRLRFELVYFENGAEVTFNPFLREAVVAYQALMQEGCAVLNVQISK